MALLWTAQASAAPSARTLLAVEAASTTRPGAEAWAETVASPAATASKSLAKLLEMFRFTRRSPGPSENGDNSDSSLETQRIDARLSAPGHEAVGTIGPRGEIRAMDGSATPYRMGPKEGWVVDQHGRIVAESSGYHLWVRERGGRKLRGVVDSTRALIFER